MSISSVNPSITPASGGAAGIPGNNPQITSLEQRLRRLNNEKKQALQSQDKEKAEELEKQIQEVRKKIEQLKQKDDRKTEEDDDKKNPGGKKLKEPELGNCVDEYV